MPAQPILLDVLLRRQNLHRYGIFQARYETTARTVDSELVGTCPSRAQLHRWLSGQLKRLPYVDHCRVLEAMFPDWTIEQLFAAWPAEIVEMPPVGPPGPALSPVSIRPYVERAFSREHISIDFFGFSGETLHGVIQEPLDKIRVRQLTPRSIDIRLLVPDTSVPMAVPCRTSDLGDDPQFRERTARIMLRHGQAIMESVQELTDLRLLDNASVRIRVHGCPPLFKLYILNSEEVFFGFYPLMRHSVTIDGAPHEVFDLMGKEASLFRHTSRDAAPDSGQYVGHAQRWYDTVWETISREYLL